MNPESEIAPLVFRLQLTEEQQRLILERTGHGIRVLPVESSAAFIHCLFGGNTLRVDRGVFVPTRITERLLRLGLAAAETCARPLIVDVGTGSGAIGLAVAVARPDAVVYATDVSPVALKCARANRARLELRNAHIRRGSLLNPLPVLALGNVTVIFANVPYVPPAMADAARRTFPEGTAIGLGIDGLDLPRQLAVAAREFLVPGGSLILQLGGFQWPKFATELTALGYAEPQLADSAPDQAVAGQVIWPGTTAHV
jgi:release factor glutamine methyltransferase